MKRFYIAVLLFMLPIFVFMGGTEYVVRQIPNEYKYKNDWMDQHAEEVETLILGNSHTEVGINPDFMKGKAFNLANGGQDYIYSHYLFFKWAEKYKSLRTIILPVSYFSFYQNGYGDSSATIQELCYHIYMGCPFHSWEFAYSIESLYYASISGKLLKFLHGNVVDWYDNGWKPWLLSNKTSVWNAEHVNKSLARNYLADSYDMVPQNYGYLVDIARYCYRHNIRLILVSTPQTKEYNACLSRQQIEYTKCIVEKFMHHYPAEYYDYRECDRFNDDDFNDQSHLSEVGAEKFTKILKKDLGI